MSDEMPPIEAGDWVQDEIGISRPIRAITVDTVEWWNSEKGRVARPNITEIRKANGTIWRREAQS